MTLLQSTVASPPRPGSLRYRVAAALTHGWRTTAEVAALAGTQRAVSGVLLEEANAGRAEMRSELSRDGGVVRYHWRRGPAWRACYALEGEARDG